MSLRLGQGSLIQYAFSITKHCNIEILLISSAQSTGQYFPILPSRQITTENQFFQELFQEGQCWSCNWKYLYCYSSLDVRLNIALALGKSFGICPWDFPRAQAIFHCISILNTPQYRYSPGYTGSVNNTIAGRYIDILWNEQLLNLGEEEK